MLIIPAGVAGGKRVGTLGLYSPRLRRLRGCNRAAVRSGFANRAHADNAAVYVWAYTSRQMLSDSVVPLCLLSGCVCHRIRNQTERLHQYLWFRYAYIHFRFIVPACGSHTVYLCDTRMLRNVDRKSSYPHCGDNRVDNVCDYPHIGDNSVDSLGTIRRPHQIDLHQSRQSAMRNNPSGTHDHTACPAAGHPQMPITITFPVWRQQLSELLTLALEIPKTIGYLRCD
ncbi:hypothetical protein CQR48_0247 [Bifidobacterium thermophilum]|nr:hypothetical protein CQR48_0247 [Bifidobacterium thermophilum]